MIKIREAGISDLPVLADLFNLYRVFYREEPDLAGAITFLSDRIKNKQSIIFLSSFQNADCGFIQLYPLFSSTRMKPLLLLNDLFVKEDYRGKKLSVALINKAKSFCQEYGACGLILETASDNAVANSLYKSTQFILDNKHNYYSWDNPNPL